MASTMQELGIDRLSIADRTSLVNEIWESLRSRSQLSESQRCEIEVRLAEHLANPDDVVSLDRIEAEAAARWLSRS